MRLLPDFAPVWCSRSSGTPSNMPPTTPSFAWNSSMMRALKSAGDGDIVLSQSMKRRSPPRDSPEVVAEVIAIERRFNGPPDSGQGGYTCGLVAEALGVDCVAVSL